MTNLRDDWRNNEIAISIAVNALDLMSQLASDMPPRDLFNFIVELDDAVGDSTFTENLYIYFKSIHDRWEAQDNA